MGGCANPGVPALEPRTKPSYKRGWCAPKPPEAGPKIGIKANPPRLVDRGDNRRAEGARRS